MEEAYVQRWTSYFRYDDNDDDEMFFEVIIRRAYWYTYLYNYVLKQQHRFCEEIPIPPYLLLR